MKKILLAPLFLVGTCAACCAVPLLLPAMVGLLSTGVAALAGIKIGLAFLLFIVLIFYSVTRWNRRRSEACRTSCPATKTSRVCACKAEGAAETN